MNIINKFYINKKIIYFKIFSNMSVSMKIRLFDGPKIKNWGLILILITHDHFSCSFHIQMGKIYHI